MPLETGTYISDLNTSNPGVNDSVGQADDHLRLIKASLKNTFPNVSGAVSPTHTELNRVAGVTSSIQTQLDAKSVNDTAAVHTAGSIELGHASDTTLSRLASGKLGVEGLAVSLNSLSDVHTAGSIELGHASDTTLTRVSAGVVAVEGNTLATLASPAFTGTPTAPSASAYTNTTQIATTAQVYSTATSVPENAQTGTTYTLVASDKGKMVTLTNASAITLTVPSGTFAAGDRVDLAQYGAGQVTVAGSGVTVYSSGSKLKFRGQYSGATLWFKSSTEALLVGDLMA